MLEKNYLSKGKWEGTYLLNQTWGKETDTWWKVGTRKFADKIGRELMLIILMFSLISRSSLSSSNVGNSSLRFALVFLLTPPTCWNFEISMASLYPKTPPQFSICRKYRWAFCLFFSSALLEASFEFLILFLHCNKLLIISPALFTSSFTRFHTSIT